MGLGITLAVGLAALGTHAKARDTAGILACVGNKAYKEYRATKGL